MKEGEARRDLGRLLLILAGLFVAYWFLLILSVQFEDDDVSARYVVIPAIGNGETASAEPSASVK